MKTLALLTLAAAAMLPAHAATNIGVSIGIRAPGQYGRIDINNYPQAELATPQPQIYRPSPVAVHQQPIYLYVPQAQQDDWGYYCGNYVACGQPVYFVREDWVRGQYQHEHAQARERRGHGNHGHKGKGRGNDKDRD
jgi:hypothetical protein